MVGEPVRHLGLGWQGVLEKLEDGRAEVLVRGKRVRCRPEELAPAGSAERSPAESAGGDPSVAVAGRRRAAGSGDWRRRCRPRST